VREAQTQLEGFGAVSFAAILAAFEAQLQLAQGDLAAAGHWLRSAGARPTPQRFGLTPQFFVYASEHLEIAPIQVLIAQGRASHDPATVHRALALIDELREKAAGRKDSEGVPGPDRDLSWLRIKTLGLQALACQVLGDTAPALEAMTQALALAEPQGYVRVLIDEGAPMAELLRQLRTRDPKSSYIATLLTSLEPFSQGMRIGYTMG
jgi:LuxR family maltose regulon positive regulatory protein